MRGQAGLTLFETKSLADDLIHVDHEDEHEILLLDSAPIPETANRPSPEDEARQRQRIVSRHIAALIEHQRYLADLEKSARGL